MPVYLDKAFWAGMSTTEGSESMNALFNKFVHSKMTLKQFIKQYENTLRDKCESRAEYESFNSNIPCVFDYDIENNFSVPK